MCTLLVSVIMCPAVPHVPKLNKTFISLYFQAIKQKLQIWPKTIWSDNNSSPQEEDKAKMLLGLPVSYIAIFSSIMFPDQKKYCICFIFQGETKSIMKFFGPHKK